MMKRSIFLITILLLAVGQVAAEDPVYFSDDNLKLAVEQKLNITDPTPTDMLGLLSLSAVSRNISSITGIEYAVKLQSLSLRLNEITDISALSSLTDLKWLDISANEIGDLSPLSGLISLENLNIHRNDLNNLSALSGLINLRALNLRENDISSCSSLSGLTNLHYLNLFANRISSVSELSSLINLTDLNICHNQITSISGLENLKNLKFLDLGDNQISNLSPLIEHTNLIRLDLKNNPLDQETCSRHLPVINFRNPGAVRNNPCVTYELTISSTAGGTVVDPGEDVFIHTDGTYVRLEAKPDPGFVFLTWTGSSSFTTRNPVYVSVFKDLHIRAHFLCLNDTLVVDGNAVVNTPSGNSSSNDSQEDGTPEYSFDSIQEAIEVAAEGSTILVRPATYHENLNLLGKNVRVIGLDPNDPNVAALPIIQAQDSGSVLKFVNGESADCIFMGFVITGVWDTCEAAVVCRESSPVLSHCLIVGNQSTDPNGAAVYCRDSRAWLENCTIAHNKVHVSGAAVTLDHSPITMINSILWGNEPHAIQIYGDDMPWITYCNIQGGWSGLTNMDTDPCFADPGYWSQGAWISGDYHLKSKAGRWDERSQSWIKDQETSVCIDAGDPNSPVGDEPIPNGGIINMGSYGGTTQATISPG